MFTLFQKLKRLYKPPTLFPSLCKKLKSSYFAYFFLHLVDALLHPQMTPVCLMHDLLIGNTVYRAALTAVQIADRIA